MKNYVSSILSKLNLERRAQAAAFVAKHRLDRGGAELTGGRVRPAVADLGSPGRA